MKTRANGDIIDKEQLHLKTPKIPPVEKILTSAKLFDLEFDFSSMARFDGLFSTDFLPSEMSADTLVMLVMVMSDNTMVIIVMLVMRWWW